MNVNIFDLKNRIFLCKKGSPISLRSITRNNDDNSYYFLYFVESDNQFSSGLHSISSFSTRTEFSIKYYNIESINIEEYKEYIEKYKDYSEKDCLRELRNIKINKILKNE